MGQGQVVLGVDDDLVRAQRQLQRFGPLGGRLDE
jgi:hypothetical protein